MEFNEDQYIKILPKCSHIFHEDCIEKWILKAKMRYICCPVCRVNIRDEVEMQEQTDQIQEREDFDPGNEDCKYDGEHSPTSTANSMNLLNYTDSNSESLA
jgi:hypothetical protein